MKTILSRLVRRFRFFHVVEVDLRRPAPPAARYSVKVEDRYHCGHTGVSLDLHGRCDDCGAGFPLLASQAASVVPLPPVLVVANDCDQFDSRPWIEGVDVRALPAAVPTGCDGPDHLMWLDEGALAAQGPFTHQGDHPNGSAILGLSDALFAELDRSVHHVVQLQEGELNSEARVDAAEAARQICIRAMRVQRIAEAIAQLAIEAQS